MEGREDSTEMTAQHPRSPDELHLLEDSRRVDLSYCSRAPSRRSVVELDPTAFSHLLRIPSPMVKLTQPGAGEAAVRISTSASIDLFHSPQSVYSPPLILFTSVELLAYPQEGC